MNWTSTLKALGVADKVSHKLVATNVIGRAPVHSNIRFSPLELYGATARCSHIHQINPVAITPELLMAQKLLDPHIDDHSPNFYVLASAKNFKDFVYTYFVGSTAAGLAYLSMIEDGYIWGDHFENLGGGNPACGKMPDFAFAGPARGIALMESKGTSTTSQMLKYRVRDGYKNQVEPHLGHAVGGQIATHGFCIGSLLTPGLSSELQIHHTEAPSKSLFPTIRANLQKIQRQSFATAFSLVSGPTLGARLRDENYRFGPNIPFARIKWADRKWLCSVGLPATFGSVPLLTKLVENELWWFTFPGHGALIFAIEERIATEALSRFYGEQSAAEDDLSYLSQNDLGFTNRPDSGGAAFPDGLAVIDFRNIQYLDYVQWDVKESRLQ